MRYILNKRETERLIDDLRYSYMSGHCGHEGMMMRVLNSVTDSIYYKKATRPPRFRLVFIVYRHLTWARFISWYVRAH